MHGGVMRQGTGAAPASEILGPGHREQMSLCAGPAGAFCFERSDLPWISMHKRRNRQAPCLFRAGNSSRCAQR
ncbi:hypothetical protein MESS4_550012 [Mesorhizobium sp. STM 4661]|nr:hypothetical protein MESS4_550012 [Mesorhizobium sp. STM 4661]